MLNKCESDSITYRIDYTILENADVYTLNIYTKVDGAEFLFEDLPDLNIIFNFSNLSYISLSHTSDWDNSTLKINYSNADINNFKNRIIKLYKNTIDTFMDRISEKIFRDFNISTEEVRDFKIKKIIE